MTEQNQRPAAVVASIVDLLESFPSEDRRKIVHAALTLLGEEEPIGHPKNRNDSAKGGRENGGDGSDTDFPARVITWMRQNNISRDDLDHSFHLRDGLADIIASDIPGANKTQKTPNAYVIAALASFLIDGVGIVADKPAREICRQFGCYDETNHSKIINAMGNELSGSKEKGWVLTAPGFKRAAQLIKEMASGQ